MVSDYFFVNMHVRLLSSEAFFQTKMQQMSFSGQAPSGPAAGAYSTPPDPIDGLKDPASKGRRVEERGKEAREG